MRLILQFTHALADPTRWRIVVQVADRHVCVCELEEGLQLPQSTLSSHLAILKKAGLLMTEKRGKWTYYRLEARHRPVIDILTTQFPEALSDATIKADRRRIDARIALRGTPHCGPGRHRAIPPADPVEISSASPCIQKKSRTTKTKKPR